MTRVVALVAALLPLAPLAARAEAVVTLCQSDRQAGAGVNLASAIKAGGEVTFNCPAGATLAVTSPMTILSATSIIGSNGLTLDVGGMRQSVFVVKDQPPFTLSGLTIKGGGDQATGAALVSGNGGVTLAGLRIQDWPDAVMLRSSGNLTVTGTTFSNARLGTIYDYSLVTLMDVTGTEGGKIAPFMSLDAGAIAMTRVSISGSLHSNLTFNALTINGSTFSDNASASPAMTSNPSYERGGALVLACYAPGCTAAIGQSRFLRNVATGGGGALSMSGGALTVSGTAFAGNGATAGFGGALSTSETQVGLFHDEFTGNHASAGGGAIFLQSTSGPALRARGVLFSDNKAGASGGAILALMPVDIVQSVFLSNTATDAAAMDVVASGTSRVANSLIVKNRGASIVHGDAFSLINSTVTANTGIGIAAFSGAVSLSNVIASNNTAGNCSTSNGGTFTNAFGNLQFGDSSCAGIEVGDPQLDAYGAPASAGPAARGGTDVVCQGAPVDGADLYGHARPAGACSIGAVQARTDRQIADLDLRYAGLLLPEAIGLGGIIYAIVGLICWLTALAHKRGAARWRRVTVLALWFVVGCSLLLAVALLVWERALLAPASLDKMVTPWLVLFALGCWALMRRGR